MPGGSGGRAEHGGMEEEEEGGCPELPGACSLHVFQGCFLYGPYRPQLLF